MKKFLVAILAVIFCLPTVALGAELNAGEDVFLPSGQQIQDNLYVAGGNVSVNSSVEGDLFAVGGNVLIAGNVSDDIAAAGGSITILGNTGGDVRVAGGNVLISGTIGGELIVTGGSVVIATTASIAKDVILAGGQVLLDGEVFGDVRLAGGVASINGHVHGKVVGEIGETLTIGPGAMLDGGLDYGATSTAALDVKAGGFIAGETVFREISHGKTEQKLKGWFWMFASMKFLVLLIAALVLSLNFKKFSVSIVEQIIKKPMRALGIGALTCLVGPLLAIVLCVSVLGAPLGLLLFLSFGLLMLTSAIFAGVVVGAWLCKLIRKSPEVMIRWQSVLVGTLLLAVITIIPFVGWLVSLVVFWMTVGSMMEWLQKNVWAKR